MNMTNVALIGCGFFAANHLHAWKGLDARLVAVCDIDADKARSAAETFGVPAWYTDAATMLDREAIDLADIATRMDTHRALGELTLGRGIATIVQKPFAPTLADAIAIRDAARDAGVFCAVHENFRFQPVMMRIAEVLAAGEIGRPTWARISFRTGYDIYATQPYFYGEERFAILDLGIHVLDLARVFMGEVKHLTCEAQRRNPKVRAEDTSTMLLRHMTGAVSIVEHTYESRRKPDRFPDTRVVIEGDRGAIAYDADDEIEITVDGRMRRETVRPPLAPWMEEQWRVAQLSVPATCAHLLERFRAGKPASTSADDNVKTCALVEAAYRSAASGKAERPPATG